MAFASLARFSLAALILLVSVRAASPPIVDLGYAQYQGVVNAELNITKFLGIRYAAPPTGMGDSLSNAILNQGPCRQSALASAHHAIHSCWRSTGIQQPAAVLPSAYQPNS